MHRGYLGPLQHAYLAGYASGQSSAASVQGVEVLIPADGMFYISAFQSGIDHFICNASAHDGASQLKFLQKRWAAPKSDIELKLFSHVSETFKMHRLKEDAEHDGGSSVLSFVLSLLGAMQHNAAMLTVRPLPDPADISRTLTPELAMPLIQLISELKPLAESVPVPSASIARGNVERFHELLESDAFATYSNAHAALSDPTANSESSLTSIRASGQGLVAKSRKLLTPRLSFFHILNIVPKIVDTIFGKLPGTLAQLAGNVAQDQLSNRQNIVIYQFDQWLWLPPQESNLPTESDS